MRAGELLVETARAYTLSTRASEESEGGTTCRYFDPETARMCAVGRCMIDPQKFVSHWDRIVVLVDRLKLSLDELLRPEYRGHSMVFWSGVQDLHDCTHYWDETGLNEEGWGRLLFLMAYHDKKFTYREDV